MTAAFAAILGGLKDVVWGRLTWLALINLIVAATLTVLAARAGLHFLAPLIPDASGWLGYLSMAGAMAASVAIIVVAIALSPAVSMVVGGLLFDIAADRVERAIGAPRARGVALPEAALNGLRIALPALALNLLAIPFYFVPGLNAVVFYGLNGFLMGREYATLAAARHMPYADAVRLRKRHGAAVFCVGLACAFIPFLAPLVGASAMARLVHALRGA